VVSSSLLRLIVPEILSIGDDVKSESSLEPAVICKLLTSVVVSQNIQVIRLPLTNNSRARLNRLQIYDNPVEIQFPDSSMQLGFQ
jgi:hypothetical protein